MNSARKQSHHIREQVSFKLREEYIKGIWIKLCEHHKLNKSDLIKFLIKKEEYSLRKPDGLLMSLSSEWN